MAKSVEGTLLMEALACDDVAFCAFGSLMGTPGGQPYAMELLGEELLPQFLLNSPHHELRKAAQRLPGVFKHPHPENLVITAARKAVDSICGLSQYSVFLPFT